MKVCQILDYNHVKGCLPRRIPVPSAKKFAEKLNHCLDELDAPFQIRERATILSRMFDIPKQLAWSLLDGQQMPTPELLNQMAAEFDVDPKWLAGES